MVDERTSPAGADPAVPAEDPPAKRSNAFPETVILLDGNQRSALAATRSLGSLGLRVVVGDVFANCLAGRSKYAAANFQYPPPESEPEGFIEAVERAVLEHRAEVLLPLTDISCRSIALSRDRLPSVAVPIPESATIERACDKAELLSLARRLGIDVPPTTLLPDADAEFDREAVARLGFPLVIKCAESNLRNEKGNWRKTRVRLAHSMGELYEILRHEDFGEHRVLLQRFIPGRGAGVFMLYQQGKLRAQFAHRRLREKPPKGGVSVLSESTRLEPKLAEQSEKLLDALDWHGIAMVEFRHGEDGRFYLMEINPRLWGTTQLAIAAGVDFPRLLYRLAIEEPLGPAPAYRLGQRLRWIPGDIDHLYLRGKEEGALSVLRGLWAFATTRLQGTDYDTWRWSDRGPIWEELKQYLGKS